MATLHIRKLNDEVQRRLRVLAARNGRSMEAEARAALAEAVASEPRSRYDPKELQEFVARMFGGKLPRASQQLIRERRREARREAKE